MGVLYSTKVFVTGGREGHAKSADGILDLKLTPPKELGGQGGATNPEQLFATGYAACFESALRLVARNKKIPISGSSVVSTVNLNSTDEKGFFLSVLLEVEVEGVDKQTAQELVDTAHTVCPYSKAIHGNVDVKLVAKAK
ncbi:organic hydroperoxide resistance protein [Legionella sp.]|uniref:organic hydroperoxide resistance protein n=1 Tax=Legionella sp. TaxID=459 RepID=UPI000CA7F722|nr:organic hydroperoxide resistance protein [Legionella sp.]PJE15832.1 MAG: organic hydroperoxide resistance protein [Legionella sp.]